jgi:hypothetical protein
MKLTGYRSPGRKATAKLLKRATVERYVMRGNVPTELEEDREFYMLFQEWKRAGTPKDGPLYAKLCKRFNEVTSAAG